GSEKSRRPDRPTGPPPPPASGGEPGPARVPRPAAASVADRGLNRVVRIESNHMTDDPPGETVPPDSGDGGTLPQSWKCIDNGKPAATCPRSHLLNDCCKDRPLGTHHLRPRPHQDLCHRLRG